MRTVHAFLALLLAVSACTKQPAETTRPVTTPTPTAMSKTKKFEYPPARRSDHVDEYHGTKVADPYRWLEDPDSPETRAWIDAENRVTFAFLESIPERARIRERMTKLWNYEKYGIPYKEGGRYFWSKNDGLQPQAVLYTAKTPDDEPRVLLDPNLLSKDGTIAHVGSAISEDGKLLAYGLATAGSDWNEWKVRDIDTGKDLDDHLKWVKFSGASWTHDNAGFFYSRYDEPKPGQELEDVNYFQKLYYHRIGTPQSQDVLVFEDKENKDRGFSGIVTDDGRYLLIHVWRGTEDKNLVYVKDLKGLTSPADGKVLPIVTEFEAEYSFIANDGPVFWFKNNLGAPRGRIIQIDLRKPDRQSWKVIVPESKDAMGAVAMVDDQFFVDYLVDAKMIVSKFDRTGKHLGEVDLPGIGSVSGGKSERTDKEAFYSFTSYLTPGEIYRYDTRTSKSTLWKKPKVDFDADAFETKQVFYRSKDGTRVPMFITHKKGLVLDGSNPTYLYGYGGFNISNTPGFSPKMAVWMEMGGVFAVANLRGGGEYGEEWHRAGTKLQKQNVFDDFIAAAEWLIANKYTSTPKLAIAGGSNGGLLVGACMTQRPDLFGAALPAVGVLDMLRFHKFTIGWAWVDDYGSSDDPEEFKALYAYSPLHNLKPGTKYPATLITTADHDDRVVPAHSFKFAAALQHAHAGDAPVLIRIETKAGHGAGKPTQKVIDEAADTLGFLVEVLDMKIPHERPVSGSGGK